MVHIFVELTCYSGIFTICTIVALLGSIPSLVCVMRENDLLSVIPLIGTNKKKVGPSYWGQYATQSKDENELILLPKISFVEKVTAGSTVYSQGKPVKSARK